MIQEIIDQLLKPHVLGTLQVAAWAGRAAAVLFLRADGVIPLLAAGTYIAFDAVLTWTTCKLISQGMEIENKGLAHA